MQRLQFRLLLLTVSTILLSALSVQAQITGFGGTTQTGWTANHTGSGANASVSGPGGASDILNITSADNINNNSYFFNTPQPLTVGGWTSSFTFQYIAGSATPADGITLTLQNDPRGPTALGGGGGSLGYSGGFSPTPVNGTNGIIHSESFHLNIFTGAGGGVGIGEFVNAGGAPSGGTYTSVTPVILNSVNNPVNVNLTYDGLGTLTAMLTQPSTGSTVTKTFATPSFQSVLGGGNTFVVGFTGATGGSNAAQQINNFTFTPVGAQVNAILDIFRSSDSISGINAVPGAGTAASSPGAEAAPSSIDSDQPSKYLNFNKAFAGILVSPAVGVTVATELSLTSANDAPERDPASYEVWGTNNTTITDISPALNPTAWQNFWTLISSGSVGPFTLRGQEQDFNFANSTAYRSYMVDFPAVANPGAANSMQIGDIQLAGPVPEPGSLMMIALGVVPLIAARRRRIQI